MKVLPAHNFFSIKKFDAFLNINFYTLGQVCKSGSSLYQKIYSDDSEESENEV